MENCATFNGDPAQLTTWLRETGAFIAKEGYPETDHPFIIRHLLIDDALDYYLAHEDIIFNFYDLRKLFLHKQNALAPLRTLQSLDSIATLTLNSTPSILTSTQLPAPTTTTADNPCATTFTFAQTLEDLTQNDIRKTLIEDLQRNSTKFTGDHRQDRFDMISQLLDKGALDWFQDNKAKFNNSWSEFVIHFKKTFDSPNRARIAMQKLNSYAQSPQQDVRSFCSEMRKLFQEGDPQMSSSRKLELLLAKVNPSYRLDLLKQKPKDPEEFEIMAKDLENTYLAFEAMEQNTQSITLFPSELSSFSFDTPHYLSSNRHQSTPYNNHNDNNYRNVNTSRYNLRFPTNTNYSPRYSSSNSSYRHNQPSSRQSFDNRQTGAYYNSQRNPQQHLFAYQPPSPLQ
ncbi:unnamed protein product [Rotaria sp. Silwood1]|nr:unnamed protein product [Rotaria sp. Silwood1]CAF3939909.1 unnamed protein product [Rotaria sp. Silwood1]CAF4933889.1 unnamed protein product [Rotaria sp. Silwood1]CAF5005356.1 unnamed protein product [Rotaria sp. Silwood1]